MPITDLMRQPQQNPYQNELVGMLEKMRQPQEPSLLDIATMGFRADAEGTSLGAQMDNRALMGQQESQQAFQNTLQMAQLFADQGDPNANAVLDAFNNLTEGMDPDQRAAVWADAEALPEDVNAENAFGTFSQIIQRGGYGVREPDAPKTVSTAEGVFVLNPDGTTGARLGSPVSQGTTVTIEGAQKTLRDQWGDPGNGLVWAANPDGTAKLDANGAPIAIPYQGGSVWQAQQLAAEEEALAAGRASLTAENKSVTSSMMTDDINRAISLATTADLPTTGYLGALSAEYEGTPAYDLAKILDGLKANIGFQRLNQMRAESPTGGALGNVTERELGLLQAVYGSLEQGQSKEQFIYNLNRLNWMLDKVTNGFVDPATGQRREVTYDDLSAASGSFGAVNTTPTYRLDPVTNELILVQ